MFLFQVSDPVATEFSLNTQMVLLSKRTLWLSDGSMGFGQESDTAFSQGKAATHSSVTHLNQQYIYFTKCISVCTYVLCLVNRVIHGSNLHAIFKQGI